MIPSPVPVPSTRNVLRVYRSASPQDLELGQAWYGEAQALAVELDPTDPRRAAAVLAVLSPQISWPRNVTLARKAYRLAADGHTVDEIVVGLPGVYRVNRRKAAEILAGADPERVVAGTKVRAFWHAIADPDTPSAVVVDRHAFDIAVGRRTDDATREHRLYRAGGYAEIAALYVRAAKILTRELHRHVTATEVQAVTWTAWRHTHSIDRRYATA